MIGSVPAVTGTALLGRLVWVKARQAIAHLVMARRAEVALSVHQERRMVACVRVVTGEAITVGRRRMQRSTVHMFRLVVAGEADFRTAGRGGRDRPRIVASLTLQHRVHRRA